MTPDLDLTLVGTRGNMVVQPTPEVQLALVKRLRNGEHHEPVTRRRICVVESSHYMSAEEAEDWAKRIAITLNAFRGVPTERLQEVADRVRELLVARGATQEAQS